MPDILFILLLALVVFGPKKLPEIARQLAKLMAQFRMARDDVRRQVESELLTIELEEKGTKTMPATTFLEPGKEASVTYSAPSPFRVSGSSDDIWSR